MFNNIGKIIDFLYHKKLNKLLEEVPWLYEFYSQEDYLYKEIFYTKRVKEFLGNEENIEKIKNQSSYKKIFSELIISEYAKKK